MALFGLFAAFFAFPATALPAASDNSVVSRNATVEGVSLHYLTAGHGPMVVLIHGYAETSRMWRPLIPKLAGAIYGDRAGPAGHWRLGHSGGRSWT